MRVRCCTHKGLDLGTLIPGNLISGRISPVRLFFFLFNPFAAICLYRASLATSVEVALLKHRSQDPPSRFSPVETTAQSWNEHAICAYDIAQAPSPL